MPPLSIRRGGLRVSNDTSASRWRRTSSIMSGAVRPVDLRPDRAAHPEQLDETFGFLDAPVGRLRVGGALRVEDVRRAHGNRVDAATACLEDHFAVDHALAGRKELFQVGLQRIMEEAFVYTLDPLACDVRLEPVL